jgi:hypothetical protein
MTVLGDGEKSYFGGEDEILAWCREGSYFHEAKKQATGCCSGAVQAVEAPHEFDYDLVVIGGNPRECDFVISFIKIKGV